MKSHFYPCLWFATQAEEAARYYCSVFPNSGITSASPIAVKFEINGNPFMALNGGERFTFNESVSFVVECDTQEEIDHCWNTLTKDGGQESMCGWLKDKYGVSWQIIPSVLPELMSDPSRSQRVIAAFLKMRKFDIETLLNS